MALTDLNYQVLWNNYFGPFLPALATPPYLEYLLNEMLFQDYLDIFRGENTRGDRGEPEDFVYPYEHPFPVTSMEKPCIKYIMVGEAAPMGATTYFYNVTHLDFSRWYDSPIAAFDCPNGRANIADKTSGLLCLAKKGYLLIDLFPFRIAYNPDLRNTLNANGVSQFFFDNHLLLIIESIINDEKICKEKPMTMAFSGPPIIHHFLVHNNHIDGILGGSINCFCYPNVIGAFPGVHPPANLPHPNPINIQIHVAWPFPHAPLNNIYDHPRGKLKKIAYYRCCCYDGSNQGPHEILIKNAFAL